MPDLPYNENVPGYLAKLQAKVDNPPAATVPTSVTDRLSAVETALPAKASATALTALAAAMPVATSATPAGIADTPAQGSDPLKFDAAGHTHASKARKARVDCAAATFTWTYPTPFAAGVVPICNGIAETTSADLINVQLMGVPTNTACQFRITRYSSGLLALLLGAISVNATPLALKLHLTAFEP